MDIYVSQFVLFVLMFARIATMIVVAPVVGHQAVPAQIKVGIGLFFSFVLFPLASSSGVGVDMPLLKIIVMALREAGVGLILGFAVGIIFAGVRYAGELISFDMGFSVANVFDPETGAQTPVVGEFLYMFTMLIFLGINGHHFVLQALQLSYAAAPVGTWAFSDALADSVIKLTGVIFVIGVKFAAPIIISLFLTNVALAILSRIMPQMNIFIVSFPAKIGVGVLALISTAPMLTYVFKKLLEQFENDVLALLQVL